MPDVTFWGQQPRVADTSQFSLSLDAIDTPREADREDEHASPH